MMARKAGGIISGDAANRSSIAARFGGQEGASFVIALIFALLVAFVATVAITSASVNAERATAPNRADDQAYYAVVSGLEVAGDLVARDVCTATVTVDADKKATLTTSGTDQLGLAEWARAQVQAIEQGTSAEPKNLVLNASDMGQADVPDVLVTLTMKNDKSIYARACVDVWGSEEVPASDKIVKSDLVEKQAAYASFLTKQVASSSSASGVVTWAVVGGGA